MGRREANDILNQYWNTNADVACGPEMRVDRKHFLLWGCDLSSRWTNFSVFLGFLANTAHWKLTTCKLLKGKEIVSCKLFTNICATQQLYYLIHPSQVDTVGGEESKVFAEVSFLKVLKNVFTFGNVRPNCKKNSCCIPISSPGLVTSFTCVCQKTFFKNGWNYCNQQLRVWQKLHWNLNTFLFVFTLCIQLNDDSPSY